MSHDPGRNRHRFEYDVRWFLLPAAAAALTALFAFFVITGAPPQVDADDLAPMALAPEWIASPLPAHGGAAGAAASLSPQAVSALPVDASDPSQSVHPSSVETH